MDISLLAQTLAAVLAPALPYLVEGGKTLVAKAGEELADGAWDKIKALWGRLRSRVEAKPAAADAVADVVKAPQDKDSVEALRIQLKKILAEDEAFAAEIAELVEPLTGGTSYQATLVGDGAIAQGPGAKAVGPGGVMVGGDVHGGIVTGRNPAGDEK
jgi:hypothetical protein